VFFKERTVYARTGRTYTARSATVFGVRLQARGLPPFALREAESVQTTLNRNFFIPVLRTSVTWYELEERAETADFESAREGLLAEVRAEAELKAEGGIRLNAASDVRDAGGYYVVSYSIEAEARIHGL
jgi:hypothetical protein